MCRLFCRVFVDFVSLKNQNNERINMKMQIFCGQLKSYSSLLPSILCPKGCLRINSNQTNKGNIMKLLPAVMALVLLVGCGSSGGGSSSSLSGASLSSVGNSTNTTLTFKALPIGKNQVIPFNNILRCMVKNEGIQTYIFNGFNVSFTSSNPLFDKINIQFIIKKGKVYVLEVNPRASRTVPFLSKVTGIHMAKVATKAMLGDSIK